MVMNFQKRNRFIIINNRGTDFVLLPQNPIFVHGTENLEPVYLPKQTILEESIRREAEKICFPDTLMNKVVYDCVDQSFYTKV
jgi:cytosolic carboxypeptidase protein 2/3